jgi:NADPH-dependent FMN reductase
MTTPIRILGIAGSLRRGSYNRAALRAATQLAPKGATVETFELVSCLGNSYAFAAADFGCVQGARKKHIPSGSATDE